MPMPSGGYAGTGTAADLPFLRVGVARSGHFDEMAHSQGQRDLRIIHHEPTVAVVTGQQLHSSGHPVPVATSPTGTAVTRLPRGPE